MEWHSSAATAAVEPPAAQTSTSRNVVFKAHGKSVTAFVAAPASAGVGAARLQLLMQLKEKAALLESTVSRVISGEIKAEIASESVKRAASEIKECVAKVSKTPIEHQPKKRRKKAPQPEVQQCKHCGRTRGQTKQWRRGPDGYNSLCNACGLRHAAMLKREASLAQSLTPKQEAPVQSLLNPTVEDVAPPPALLPSAVCSVPSSASSSPLPLPLCLTPTLTSATYASVAASGVGQPLSPQHSAESDGSSASSPMLSAPSASPCTSPIQPPLSLDDVPPLDPAAASRPSSCFTAEHQSETGMTAMAAKIQQLEAALADLQRRAAPAGPATAVLQQPHALPLPLPVPLPAQARQVAAPTGRPPVQRHIWSATSRPPTVIVKTEPRAAAHSVSTPVTFALQPQQAQPLVSSASLPTLHGLPANRPSASASLDSFALSMLASSPTPAGGTAGVRDGSRTLAAYRAEAAPGPVSIPNLHRLDVGYLSSSTEVTGGPPFGGQHPQDVPSGSDVPLAFPGSLSPRSFRLKEQIKAVELEPARGIIFGESLEALLPPTVLDETSVLTEAPRTVGHDSTGLGGESTVLSDSSWSVDAVLADVKPDTPPYVDTDEIGFLSIPEDLGMMMSVNS